MTNIPAEEQEERRKRRAVLLLLPVMLLVSLCCIWTLFANTSTGEAQSFIPAPLHSSALADYSEDDLLGRMRSLSITIIESVIRDHDPEADDADLRATEVMESMRDPVPTVTPLPGQPSVTPSPHLSATVNPLSTPSLTPAPSDTSTPGPSPTQTSTSTQTNTPTPGPSPTPCYVTPIAYVEFPSDGTFYGLGDDILGHAHAHDPDDVNPIGCSPTPEVDGAGIVEVEFRVKKLGATVFTILDASVEYCAFGGNWPCPTVSVSGGVWPNLAPIEAGVHQLWIRARDNEGQWSLWDYVTFTISLATPTPTPSNTPGPSPTPSATPSATNTLIPPSDTPVPSSTPLPSPTTVPSTTPIPSATPLPACPDFQLSGFGDDDSNHIWWTLTNTAAVEATIVRIDLTWTSGDDLTLIELDGSDMWNGSLSPTFASIPSMKAFTGVSRLLTAGQSKTLELTFGNSVDNTYSIEIESDAGCTENAIGDAD
jgi:hypothetical protein